jgi:hypothetical protein
MNEAIPVKCPNCQILIGKVEGKKGNKDPNWPNENPPDTIHLMCPDCIEGDSLTKGYTPEQSTNTRKRREDQLRRMKWIEGGLK